MKKVKIEDMPIRITYSGKKMNKDNLCKIYCAIIDREMTKDNDEREGDKHEKECMSNES